MTTGLDVANAIKLLEDMEDTWTCERCGEDCEQFEDYCESCKAEDEVDILDFIDDNREDLASFISGAANVSSHIIYNDNEEIELWINNDEFLYNWAKDCGVNI